MANKQDVGERALDAVFSGMMIEERWSTRSDRGFRWWAKDFEQHISVTRPVASHGFQVARLSARTPIVTGVRVDGKACGVLSMCNCFGSTLNALILDDDGVISYALATTVHEETLEHAPRIFGLAAGMQAGDAQAEAHTLAQLFQGQLATSKHPTSGFRPDLDDVLNLKEGLILPQGRSTSRWRGPEMLKTLKLLERTSMMASGDEDKIVAEFPYLTATSLLKFDTSERHPDVGAGLHVTLSLPESGPLASLASQANGLNRLEAQSSSLTDFRGAWCVSPDNTLAFTAFYPNVFFARGMGTNIALSMMMRAEWAATLKDKRPREERWAAAKPSFMRAMEVTQSPSTGISSAASFSNVFNRLFGRNR